jgi:hypothetical protein
MIRDVYSGSRIPDLNFSHPGYRILGSKKHRILFGDSMYGAELEIF